MTGHNFGLCRKCGQIHNRENARIRNSYKKEVFHGKSGRKFSSCAGCFRTLKDGEKFFKRTIHYHFRQPNVGIGCVIGYYCESCYNRRAWNGRKET